MSSTYVMVNKATVDADLALRNKMLNRSNSEIIDEVRIIGCATAEADFYLFEVHSDDLNRTDIFDSYTWYSGAHIRACICAGNIVEPSSALEIA